MKKIQLSDHFTYHRLLKFTFPSIIMMIFTSLYGVVDGVFVSNYAGKTAFAAINLIWPVVMILGAIGFMFGTGGSALVAKILGEQNQTYANRVFSSIVYTSALLGSILSILGLIYIRPIAVMLGAEGQLAEDTVLYGSVLFIAVATALSQVIGCVIPLGYFIFNKKGVLQLGKPGWYPKEILKSCTNGASEMLSNISLSFVNILYNIQFFKIAGENGLSAYGVMMYINFVFVSAFLGYSMGVAPVISYHYGAKNPVELHNLMKKSMVVLAVCSVAMFLSAELLSVPFSAMFVGFDETLYQMTSRGFMIYSASFLLSGFNIFSSAFFTALNNGVVSAVLSFLRTLVFPIITVWIFPLFFGLDGLWGAVIGAEFLAILVSIGFLLGNQKRYQY